MNINGTIYSLQRILDELDKIAEENTELSMKYLDKDQLIEAAKAVTFACAAITAKQCIYIAIDRIEKS